MTTATLDHPTHAEAPTDALVESPVESDTDDLRNSVAEVLDALDAAADRRDDPLLALTVEALKAVHGLYGGYGPHAVASTPPVNAHTDINQTLARALRGA